MSLPVWSNAPSRGEGMVSLPVWSHIPSGGSGPRVGVWFQGRGCGPRVEGLVSEQGV